MRASAKLTALALGVVSSAASSARRAPASISSASLSTMKPVLASTRMGLLTASGVGPQHLAREVHHAPVREGQ